MVKKALFFIVLIIISTSAFAKTFNQKFQDAMHLSNDKKYEKALSIFLSLEKDLHKQKLKNTDKINILMWIDFCYNELSKKTVTKNVVFASDWAGTSENLINNKIQNLLKAEKLLKKIDKSSKLYDRSL